MNITEFFQHRSGQWLAQCTRHNLGAQQSTSNRLQLVIEVLDRFSGEGINGDMPHTPTCALKVAAENRVYTLIALGEDAALRQGQVWRWEQGQSVPVAGRFLISDDDVLTLGTTIDNLQVEEKLWFPLPNLCMRTLSTIGAVQQASFWTEVRKSQ